MLIATMPTYSILRNIEEKHRLGEESPNRMTTEAQTCQSGQGLLSANFSRKVKKDTRLRLRAVGPSKTWSHVCAISQGSANSNCQGQDSKYLGSSGPAGSAAAPFR